MLNTTRMTTSTPNAIKAQEAMPSQFILELGEASTAMELSGLSSAILPTLGSTIWLDSSWLESTLERSLETADEAMLEAFTTRRRLETGFLELTGGVELEGGATTILVTV